MSLGHPTLFGRVEAVIPWLHRVTRGALTIMRVLRNFRRSLRYVAVTVAVVLSGCSALQSGGGARVLRHAAPSAASRIADSRSWMGSDAKDEDLVYVADGRLVYAYALSSGKLEGKLFGGSDSSGLCSDRKGNVFVPNRFEWDVLEYAHGETKPIAVLRDLHGEPHACAVDPTTGNLAVADDAGGISVYAGAAGTGKVFTGFVDNFYTCTYDDNGNLFADGSYGPTRAVGVAELSRGGKHFTPITLAMPFHYLGAIMWDGKYLAVANPAYPAVITQFRIRGATGTKAGSIALNGVQYVGQFWIHDKKLIAPSAIDARVTFYPYPAGGDSTKSLTDLESPSGLTVSVASPVGARVADVDASR